MKSLDKILQKLAEPRFKGDVEKSLFGHTKTEHLGFWVSKDGLMHL